MVAVRCAESVVWLPCDTLGPPRLLRGVTRMGGAIADLMCSAPTLPCSDRPCRSFPPLRGPCFQSHSYFGAAGSVSSVYCWDNEGAPAACWCVKKEIPEGGRYVNGGSWDTVHVFEVKEAAGGAGGKSSYRLTSTVMLSMRVAKAEVGQCDLSGHLTRKDARELLVTADGVQTHVTNMGKMVEEMETALRDSLDNLYISKTAEALAAVRTYNADSPVASSAFVADLTSAIGAHALKKATKSGAGAE